MEAKLKEYRVQITEIRYSVDRHDIAERYLKRICTPEEWDEFTKRGRITKKIPTGTNHLVLSRDGGVYIESPYGYAKPVYHCVIVRGGGTVAEQLAAKKLILDMLPHEYYHKMRPAIFGPGEGRTMA